MNDLQSLVESMNLSTGNTVDNQQVDLLADALKDRLGINLPPAGFRDLAEKLLQSLSIGQRSNHSQSSETTNDDSSSTARSSSSSVENRNLRPASPFDGLRRRGRSPARPLSNPIANSTATISSQPPGGRGIFGSSSNKKVPPTTVGRQERKTRSRSPFSIFQSRKAKTADYALHDEKKEEAAAAAAAPHPVPAAAPYGERSFISGRESPMLDPSADQPMPPRAASPMPARACSPMPSQIQQQHYPQFLPSSSAAAASHNNHSPRRMNTEQQQQQQQQRLPTCPSSPYGRPGLQEDDDGADSVISSHSPMRSSSTRGHHARSHTMSSFSPRMSNGGGRRFNDDHDDESIQKPPTLRRNGHRKSISDTNLVEMSSVTDAMRDLGLPDLLSSDESTKVVLSPPSCVTILTPPPRPTTTTTTTNVVETPIIAAALNNLNINDNTSAHNYDNGGDNINHKTGKGKMRRKGGTTPTFVGAATIEESHPTQFYAPPPLQQQQQQQHPLKSTVNSFPFSSSSFPPPELQSTGNSFPFSSSSFPPPDNNNNADSVRFVVDLSKPKRRQLHGRRVNSQVHHNFKHAPTSTDTSTAASNAVLTPPVQQQQPTIGLKTPGHERAYSPMEVDTPVDMVSTAPVTANTTNVAYNSPPSDTGIPVPPPPSPINNNSGADVDVKFNLGSPGANSFRVNPRRKEPSRAFRGGRRVGPTFAVPENINNTNELETPPLPDMLTNDCNMGTPPLPLFGESAADAVAASAAAAVDTPNVAEMERMAAEAEKARRDEAVAVLRNDARSLFVAGDYRASIHKYTQAIQLFGDDVRVSEPNDTLAVLFSNRAACFNMLGAYDAALMDCKEALPRVSDCSGTDLSTDGGPILKVKLLTRQARAILKQGDHLSALGAFMSAMNVATSTSAMLKVLNPHRSGEYQQTLAQMETEAALGKMDAERLGEICGKIETCLLEIRRSQHHHGRSMNNGAAEQRRSRTEALGHVNLALRIASASVNLLQTKVDLLTSMKRWREAAGFCERLAASQVNLDGVFVNGLESRNPYPGVLPAQFLTSSFFGDARTEDDISESELKLSSRAAAEAVMRLPYQLSPYYLRALRLEERYPAADAALRALEEMLEQRYPAVPRTRASWVSKERNKLERTKNDRELGDSLFRESDYDLAASQYASCLSIDGEGINNNTIEGENAGGRLHAVLHCNRAACLMAVRKYTEAIDECTAALRIHPRYMKALLRRSRCYVRQHRYPEAIAEYTRWLDMVEEARSPGPKSTVFVSPCLFDGPKDASDADIVQVGRELDEVHRSKQRAEAAAHEEANRRRERQTWQDTFSSSASYNDDVRSTSSAYQRREDWYNRENDSRRWDPFSGRRPKTTHTTGRTGTGHHRSRSWGNSRNPNANQELPRGSPGSDPSVDHYTVLQLSNNATDDQIKKNYRKLALLYHPDKNGSDDASDKFRRIKLAYDTLGDAALRQQYDAEQRRNRRF